MIPASIFSGKSAEKAAGLLPAAPSGLCASQTDEN